jgi:hypothetical protein
MLIVFLFVFAGLLIGVGCYRYEHKTSEYHDTGMGQFVLGTILASALLVSAITAIYSHADNVGTVRAQKYAIAVQQQRIAGLEANVVSLKAGVPGALPNRDAPIKALIDQLAAAQGDLATARMAEAEARIDIERRKAGPFWFVVWIYGEP